MGLLLKSGININLIKSALIAFFTISTLIILINIIPATRKIFPNYSLQLSGLIGNTSFLGIPIALALLPTETINFTIGFDLGTTLFSWIFGPYLLENTSNDYISFNFRKLLIAIFNSPASRGIIGVLIVYVFGLEKSIGNFLWIPARIVIFLAIIVVGARLAMITNEKNLTFQINDNIKYSLLLKLFFLPLFVFIICKILNFQDLSTIALVLQAGTPTAISTVLMAEAYKINRDLASNNLFLTTIISMVTIPIIASFTK